jgi:hypothetical protein
MEQSSPQPWLRRLGDLEGCAAVVCAVIVFTAQTTPAQRFEVPWLWMAVWALGVGCGVGAVRFGSPLAQFAGGVAAAALVVVLLALAVIKLTHVEA